MQDGFLSVAAEVPGQRLADCTYNASQIIDCVYQASRTGEKILVFPELSLTGATCGDLFFQPTLLDDAMAGLGRIAKVMQGMEAELLVAVGLPVRARGRIYNCAALLFQGKVLRFIAKTNLPPAQRRWFSEPDEADSLSVFFEGKEIPLTTSSLVECSNLPNLCVGVEFGDDLFALEPASTRLVKAGATLILNLSALPGEAGFIQTLTETIVAHSRRLRCGYVLANAGYDESVSDRVYSGRGVICEAGEVLEAAYSFGANSQLDLDALGHPSRGTLPQIDRCAISLSLKKTNFTRHFSRTPFNPHDRREIYGEMLELAAQGLARRLEHTHAKTAVLGLSGGLDSTLAALIAVRALDWWHRPHTDLLCVTMPCFGTTSRTRSNAEKLAQCLGATLRTVDIGPAVTQHFADIGQDVANHDVTFENAQARERTQVLMDIANQTGGLVIGTGDLSELALGWCTYNGDHMSMYSVNASIPKTMIRPLVATKANAADPLGEVLRDILDTPVSPELLPAEDDAITQKTEDIVGPYELHDFFLYYVLKFAYRPRKIFRLAQWAFNEKFDDATILKWLKVFYRRFFAQQFKRNACPDGPAVTGVSLSPRGGWVMPSDACADLWLKELDSITVEEHQ